MTAKTERSGKAVRVALAGYGTVGAAVARLLGEEADRFGRVLGAPLELRAVLDRSHGVKDTTALPADALVTESLEKFLAIDADIVIETVGGSRPAEEIIERSLRAGRAVVTANKLLIAKSGARYLDLARRHGTHLGFEATVAGGIPIVRSLRRSLFADRIESVKGILNGTCNFILSEMAESGRRFQDVLSQAQSLGYAEADPHMDVSGRDTADKLAILAAFAFGCWVDPEEIPTRGIADIHPIDFEYARKLGGAIRLLGVAHAEGEEVVFRVAPHLIDRRLPLSRVSGVLNAVEVTGRRLGSALFSGRGAGGDPTAVSVVSDVLNAALWLRGLGEPALGVPGALGGEPIPVPAKPATSERERNPFYLRFFVEDHPGIIAAIAASLARERINIEAVFQASWPDRSDLPFVILVEETSHATMRRALEEIAGMDFNRVAPMALPVLR